MKPIVSIFHSNFVIQVLNFTAEELRHGAVKYLVLVQTGFKPRQADSREQAFNYTVNVLLVDKRWRDKMQYIFNCV